MKRPQKTVFLSYRRADIAWAHLIYQSLTQRGFDVFIDYQGLGSGKFESEILENIAGRAHFLVVLTPTALDRVDQPGDWLRREVEYAISVGRNVVPLLLARFDFNAENVRKRLTGGLARLREYNGLAVHEEYVSAAIDRLERSFLNEPVDMELRPLSPAAEATAQTQQDAAKADATALPPVAPPPPPLPDIGAHWPASALVLHARSEGAAVRFELGTAPAAQRSWQRAAIEPLVRELTRSTWMPPAQTLHAMFQQVLPNEIKAPLRGAAALELCLDPDTAGLPWELMQAEAPNAAKAAEPLGIRTAIVRRFVDVRSAQRGSEVQAASALVIANPSTAGFGEAFAQPSHQSAGSLPALPGARKEGQRTVEQFSGAGFQVEATADEANAVEVLSALHMRPWRILHVAAHGVAALACRDGLQRSGVVLSDGVLLTGADIATLEACPELVVLTCEYLGSQRTAASDDPLAGNFVRALLDGGVCCLVAPAWNAGDDAACTFSSALYRELLDHRADFGSAVLAARRAVWRDHPGDSTWASFQAWGDPTWRARPPV